MAEFKKGDRVLVTLSGIEVPATVNVASDGYVSVSWEGSSFTNGFDLDEILVRRDPAYAVEVGTVLNSVADLTKITGRIALVDSVYVVGVWDGEDYRMSWAIVDNNYAMTSPESVVFPATVLWVAP